MISTGFDWLENRAYLTPNHTALMDMDKKINLTYKELNERVKSIAQFLWGKGIRKGDRIALLAPNDIAYIELIFASAKIGSIFVPFNTRFSAKDIDYLLKDSQPKLLFVHPQFLEMIENIDTPPIILLDADDNKTDQQIIKQNWEPYEAMLDYQGELPPPFDLEMSDPWIIIYTGGTTGFPKGAVLSYRSIVWNSLNTIVSWGIKETDVTITYLPMFHTGGLNALTMPVLHMGGTVVIGRQFVPEMAVKQIQEVGCTIILLVPTMHHMLVKTEEFQTAPLSPETIFLSGGAPCPLTIYDAYQQKGLTFKEGYGLSEAGPNNFYMDPQEVIHKKGSVGKPMFYNEVKIVNEEEQEAPIGDVGEIWLKGPHLFEYYWNKDEETKKAFHDNWFKTGDLGKRDKDGYHYIVGRKKEMIISGGENIFPLEIETVLQQHPLVEEVAVVGIPDEKWGEVTTAFVSIKGNLEVAEQELKDFVSSQIARYKVPKKIVFLDELPKTAVGKIAKADLQKKAI